jgi:hypothetical protein
MSKTLNAIVFDIHSTEKDAVALRAYATDANTLLFRRTAAKRTKDFVGMRKSEMKHTVTGADGSIIGIQTVATSIRADADPAIVNAMNATTKAAMGDAAYDNLILDERLPLNT